MREATSREQMTNDPDVTIVVVPREQFSKSQSSLESIYAATPLPFRLGILRTSTSESA